LRLIDLDKDPCKDCDTTCVRDMCERYNDWLNTPIQYDAVHCSELMAWKIMIAWKRYSLIMQNRNGSVRREDDDQL